MNDTCNRCGNPVPTGSYQCPHCGSYDLEIDRNSIQIRRVDIGHKNQSVKQARTQLDREVMISKRRGDDALIVIHGHGSTGKGGEIKQMVRDSAAHLVHSRKIEALAPGEDLYRESKAVKPLLRRFPFLRELKEWGKKNRGITVFLIGR